MVPAIGCALFAVASSAMAAAPLIWQLEGRSNTVWLMGSIHVLRAADYPLPDAYHRAYAAADELLMEIDLDNLDPLEVQRALSARGAAGRSESLRGLLGMQAHAVAKQKAGALGIDLEQLDGVEPWYAALTIVQLRLHKLGFDPRFGVDRHFASRAAADGKRVRGLETFDGQLAILDELSAALQRDFLIQSLDEAMTMDCVVESLLDAWKTGDADHLERELLGSLREYPALYEALVVRRNRNWIEPILALREAPRDVLVIVGALHLIGPDGVIEMLRERGLQVQRLQAVSE
ncbi:TraB/GumN family protein [soil metagenome]